MSGLSAAFLEELLQCSICHDMMWEPASLCCGHSFCQRCLEMALQRARECPLCRAPCYTAGVPKTNIMLAAMLREAFPDREVPPPEMPREDSIAEPAPRVLPLFLASSVQLPHSAWSMDLFELRYRLLVRRALDSGGDFAVVWARGCYGFPLMADTASLAGVVACIAHIDRSHQLPDGRWKLMCRGLVPARIEECWVEVDTDNLYMARVIPQAETELVIDAEDVAMAAPEGEASHGGEAQPSSVVEDPGTAGTEAPPSIATDSTPSTVDSVSMLAEGPAATGESAATPGESAAAPEAPMSQAEQLRFLCTQLHVLGVAPQPEAPPSDLARFTWEAAAGLASPFGYISPPELQALLQQSSAAQRLELLCSVCREASSGSGSLEFLLKSGLQRLGPVAVLGAAAAWVLSSAGSQLAGQLALPSMVLAWGLSVMTSRWSSR